MIHTRITIGVLLILTLLLVGALVACGEAATSKPEPTQPPATTAPEPTEEAAVEEEPTAMVEDAEDAKTRKTKTPWRWTRP